MNPRHTIPQLAKHFGITRGAMFNLLIKYRVPCQALFLGKHVVRFYSLTQVKRTLTQRMKRRRKVFRKL